MNKSTAQKKILIVDDEPDVVAYLEMLLHDEGYQTLSAADGQQGLELARREKPDLVTLDVSMPEASGTRFYRDIRGDDELAATPVVVITAVTGYAGDEYAYDKFLSGRRTVPPPEAYFPKPIDKGEFLKVVERLLA